MNIENRTTHNVAQGSPEWLALRAGFYTASEAPAMAGESRYAKREELIAAKATGITQEPDSFKQALYDRGHAAEAAARPLAEEIIDDDLSPVTMTAMVDGLPLLASMDGLNFDGTIGWETKLWNEALAADVRANTLSPHYTLQMDQQILVSGAERILFTCSDGTPERTVSCWYESTPERSAQLVAGWRQFAADLAAYVPPEAKSAPVVADAMESLPAVSMRLEGKLAVISNLPDFATQLRAFIERIPAKPDTDQDFANAEFACKALKRAEDALTAGEDAALGEMVDFEAMRRQVRDLKELARITRLATEKLVTARKEQIRGEIVAGGIAALRKHIDELNAAMPVNYMPQVPADFAGAIKGKRTVDSLRSAVNDELARAKIAASEIANRIHANVKTLQASGLVVHDTAALVLKAPDDLAAIIANRVTAEQQRQEAERERIRKEEADRADREAREKLAAEERAAQAAITQAAKAETLHPAVAADLGGLVREQHTEAVATLDAQQVIGTAQRMAAAPAAAPAVPAAPAERTGPPTLNIGTIKERLAHMTVTAENLRALGFAPAGRERAAPLYHDEDFPEICEAIAAQALAAKAEFLKSRVAVAA
ncbi:YqaJ viral recombinase family protein [Acidovorax sp. FJL06]|uniref:YqaJ viral recombinase family protein n=1 Tax=Acidovorax sp. FJL06 TaxID=2153365 RepID=UPI000F58136C|nr:YqaJ viral recombinase family protein [Acidovorax sp. FJL06]RQO83527.1 Heme peroxidase [Acidovorax sp. FJL06]